VIGMGALLDLEQSYWQRGYVRVAGVDEAGRGPLAGPVAAAAVVLDPDFAATELRGALCGLTDSKQLTERRRDTFYHVLMASEFVDVGVAFVEAAEIDRLNIRNATHLAMARALEHLSPLPDVALIDGLPVSGLPCASEAVVRGDSSSLSIAAASIVAKVTRDARMRELDAIYPQYGFARHKGYGTPEHVQALLEFGPCCEHRLSFRPVRETSGIHGNPEG
jgi:ribonuclease HII